MTVEIKVPVLPESVADATIATWHKKPGDIVYRDEILVDIETDKVILEVSAPSDGSLATVLKPNGATVKAQEVIAIFNSSVPGTIPEVTASVMSNTETPNIRSENNVESETEEVTLEPIEETVATSIPSTAMLTSKISAPSSEGLENAADLSPSQRRALHGHDLNALLESGATTISAEVEQAVMQPAPVAAPVAASASASGGRVEERVPMSRLRAKIAERLLAAQHNAAILTTFNEINMQPVITLRNKYKEEFEHKYGVRLGYMSFFVSAVVEALKQFPAVNASIDGNDIVYHGYFDIGIAVSTERGLVVPILRNADTLSMAEIEKKIKDFSEQARTGKIALEDITGGTFTITNGGVFGSLMATPILNPPQSGILGMHKIEERPVVENKQVVIRPMMYVALSYDHRIIDGAESVQFLVTVKELLEDPARLVLRI